MSSWKNKIATIRVPLFFIVLVLMYILPWWVSLPLLLVLTIYFPLYFEVLFFGFLFDRLYTPHGYIGLISATIVLLVVTFVRDRVRT